MSPRVLQEGSACSRTKRREDILHVDDRRLVRQVQQTTDEHLIFHLGIDMPDVVDGWRRQSSAKKLQSS
jgi:hypothetical protein